MVAPYCATSDSRTSCPLPFLQRCMLYLAERQLQQEAAEEEEEEEEQEEEEQ